MSDVNRGPISPTEKQYLDDLETAKRLSLDAYELEKKRRSKPFSSYHSSNSKIISSPSQQDNFSVGNSRKVSITPRPRPFSRAISTNSSGGSGIHLPTSLSTGKISQSPSPVSIDPPPQSLLRRNRSLPYRHKNSSSGSQRRNDTDGTITPAFAAQPTVGSVASHSNGNHLNEWSDVDSISPTQSTLNNSASDDLILLASPKVTPKFSSRTRIPNLCDISSPSTISISSNDSSSSLINDGVSPSVLSGNGKIDLRAAFNHLYPVSPPQNPIEASKLNSCNFNNGYLHNLKSPTIFPGSLSPIVVGNNNNNSTVLSLRTLIPPFLRSALTPSQTPPSASTNTILDMSGIYPKLPEDLNSMSMQEDLIDLGQQDRNILHYFDPILLREKSINDARTQALNASVAPTEHQKPERSSTLYPNLNLCIAASAGPSITPRNSIESASKSFTMPGASISRSSSSTPSGDPQSISVYPSLQEFDIENLYSGFDQGKDTDDLSSFYEVYKPFEYVYTVSNSSTSASSAYEKSSSASAQRPMGFSHFIEGQPSSEKSVPPPALPPRNSEIPLEQFVAPSSKPSPKVPLRSLPSSPTSDTSKRHGRLYENIENVKHFSSPNSEIQAFYEMIKELRFSSRHTDTTSNWGFIRCTTLEAKCSESLSLKVIVWNEMDIVSEPATFTCSVSTTPDLIIAQSLMNLDLEGPGEDYLLRVKGLNEYMCTDVPLAKYSYVQECIKMDNDIQLILVPKTLMERISWARTPRDDADAVSISIDDILPLTNSKTITYNEIRIPLEVLDSESELLKKKLAGSSTTKDMSSLQLNPSKLIQPVKAVCVLLGEVQTVEIMECMNAFVKCCTEWNSKLKTTTPTPERDSRRRTKIGNDCNSRLSFVEILPKKSIDDNPCDSVKELVLSALYQLEDSVRHLVEMYSKSFPVSFRMKESSEKIRVGWSSDCKPMSDMGDPLEVRIGAIHRLKPEWLSTYVEFVLTVEVFHGRRLMGKAIPGNKAVTKSDNNLFFNTVLFNSWIAFDRLPICILPRESRVVFSLYGRKPNEDSSNFDTVELGWASMQLLNFKALLAQGKYLLPFWPVGLLQKRLGPAPDSSFSSDGNATLISIEFKDFGYDLPFPEIPTATLTRRDFVSLDPGTQSCLSHLFDYSTFTKPPPELVEILWEKRHYLHEFPRALPKVLLAAQLWDYASLAELHAMLLCWEPMDPIDALQLLLPCFPDAKVREQGMNWVSKMPDEELINMLPQLLESLSYETFDYSPLARFLLQKALSCLRISHHLFWLLVSQVGLGKWVSEFAHDTIITSIPQLAVNNAYDPKRRRLELMLNSIMVMAGAKWKSAFISQCRLMEGFYDLANQMKVLSNSSRTLLVAKELAQLQEHVFNSNHSIPLPLSASNYVESFDIKSSSFFTSASVPLKVSLANGLAEKGCTTVLYKVGDDIRQDMLTVQIIRVVEKWWLEAGLDLRVLTFACVPTGYRQGFVEMVPHSETLCRIQAEHGLTGVFRNRPISEWLIKMNPSTLDYRRATENFTLSCAAYCVITYILGICDRHNDNIMLTKKGHLFHIDFGKFLGDAQMFGSLIRRDRTPFVLTSDMVYVINDGQKDSSRFHRFVEICCQAFKVIRQNGDTLVNLFGLMATSGIPGVNSGSVQYIQTALLPAMSHSEAASKFAGFIQESLQNWFTPVNFFLHTLAQMPFAETSYDPTKLSFVPNVYTMESDGRIEHVNLVSFVKKYDPEKCYVYILQVRRKGSTEWTTINRTYKEFMELHSKLVISFPKGKGALGNLPRGSGLTRSQVKQVAEKRKVQLQDFLKTLFTLADEISHSNLVYTFFHPLLRDEEQHQEDEEERRKSSRVSLARNPARIHGQIKISLEYQRGTLLILILHAVDLACPNGTPPSAYVKTYLQPDGNRTKRKTKVVKRSQHPTFMETLEYRLPLEYIQARFLTVSVWHHDPFQENNFLGGVTLPMASLSVGNEAAKTYTLGNIVSQL